MEEIENAHLVGSLLAPEIGELIDQRQTFEVRSALLELLDPEVADVLMALVPGQRAVAFRLLPRDRAAMVFTYLPFEQQEQLLSELNNEQLAHLINEMPPDDRAVLFEEMPGPVAARLLALMRPEERRQTQIILGYPQDSVGRLMTPDYLAIKPDWTVQQVLDHIRQFGRDAETLSTLYVVNERGLLIDDIRLRQFLLVDPSSTVRSLMDEQFVSLRADEDREAAVRAINRYDQSALPVVDREGVLVGIVTFDDVADVATAETTEDIQKMGGLEALDEPYITMPLLRLVRKRGTWLSALFLGEMLTATAMGYFQVEIEKASVLALFMPLIISSGGNSGSQGSTLIIRAMAVGEVGLKHWIKVFRRELACGLLLGVLLGLLGLIRIHLWQFLGWKDYSIMHGNHAASYHMVALTVGIALIGVVLWGTLMGSMLPFLLRRIGLDPATISAPLVATLVDVTGLIIYFSTAMVILHSVLGV